MFDFGCSHLSLSFRLLETNPMARTGRPVTTLALTLEERAELMARLSVRKAPADEKLRIRVVLGCADGESGTHIAQRLKTSAQTVSKWCRRLQCIASRA